MMRPSPSSSSPWVRRPSGATRRSTSTKPNAAISQSIAALPSSYAIIGTTNVMGSLLSSSCNLGGLVFPPHLSERRAAFADGDVVGQGGLERRHQVLGTARPALDAGETAGDDRRITPRTQQLQGTSLGCLMARPDLHDLDLVRGVVGVTIDADHHPLTGLDPGLKPIGAVGDSALGPPRFDALHGTAELVDLGHDRKRLLLDPVGEAFDVVRTAQRIGNVRHGRFIADDL